VFGREDGQGIGFWFALAGSFAFAVNDQGDDENEVSGGAAEDDDHSLGDGGGVLLLDCQFNLQEGEKFFGIFG
jgi:hypothetical protein